MSTKAGQLQSVEGARVGDFTFSTRPIDGTLRVQLLIDSPFGPTEVPARLDLGRRPLWLPPENLVPLHLPIHERYGFELTPVPTARLEEVIAEKLARFRRASLARDLYDLAWLAARPFDEALVRRVTVLKVWCDVVDDGLGRRPFDAEDIVRPRSQDEFQPEAIGYLTAPVDVPAWMKSVRERFAFMRELDDFEVRISGCCRADEWDVRQAIAGFDDDRADAE